MPGANGSGHKSGEGSTKESERREERRRADEGPEGHRRAPIQADRHAGQVSCTDACKWGQPPLIQSVSSTWTNSPTEGASSFQRKTRWSSY